MSRIKPPADAGNGAYKYQKIQGRVFRTVPRHPDAHHGEDPKPRAVHQQHEQVVALLVAHQQMPHAGEKQDQGGDYRYSGIGGVLESRRGCIAQQHVPHHTAAAGCGQPQDTYAENVHILVDPHKSAGSGKGHGSDQFKNQEKLFQAAYPSF